MSIKNFSDVLFARSIENSVDTINIGSFTNDATPRQLGNIRILMFFDGIFSSESVRLSITDSLSSPTVTTISDWVSITDLDPSLSSDTNYLGWVNFDFGQQWLQASTEYFLVLGANGYTETATKSINTVFDYPLPVIGSREDSFQDHPAAMQIFGYER
jgi:hypothetical protein